MEKKLNTMRIQNKDRWAKKRVRGVSLFELVLYMFILGTLSASVVSLIGANETMRRRNSAISEVESQGREAMRFMVRSVQGAQSVSLPAQGSGTPTTQLSLLSDASVETNFSVNAGVVYVKEGANTPLPITAPNVNINNVSFENLGQGSAKGSIRIQFDATGTISGTDTYTKTFYGSATPR